MLLAQLPQLPPLLSLILDLGVRLLLHKGWAVWPPQPMYLCVCACPCSALLCPQENLWALELLLESIQHRAPGMVDMVRQELSDQQCVLLEA